MEGMPDSQPHRDFIGLDFGTTNSTVAIKSPNSPIQIATFPFRGEQTPSFRSVLYFEQVKSAAGPGAPTPSPAPPQSSIISKPMKRAA